MDFAFGSPGSEPVPQAPGWHGRGHGGIPAPAVLEDGALRGSGRWIKRRAPWGGQEVKTSLGLSRAYPVLVLKCLWECSPSPVGKGVSSYPPGAWPGEPATPCVTRSEHQREMPERSNNPC